jgi:hypothetical protein
MKLDSYKFWDVYAEIDVPSHIAVSKPSSSLFWTNMNTKNTWHIHSSGVTLRRDLYGKSVDQLREIMGYE